MSIEALTQQVQDLQSRIQQTVQALFDDAIRFQAAGDMHNYEVMLRRIFELDPTCEAVYWPFGSLLITQRRRAEALAFYQAVTKHAPANIFGHHNVGMLLRWEKRWDESEAAFRRMMQVDPEYSVGRVNFGALLLTLGRYTEGWELNESRYIKANGELIPSNMVHNAPYVRFTGSESLTGKSIMIIREQGYGDEVMFARFATTLKERGASKVAIFCQAAIHTLMETVSHVDAVYSLNTITDWPAGYDYWSYGFSLPHALGITLENLPAPIPYIAAKDAARAKWHDRIAEQMPTRTAHTAPLLKVGLVWRGSAAHGNDHHRSLPNLATLAPLWDVPNIQFISVQAGEPAQEAKQPPAHQLIIEMGSQLADFADGAALISELDLLISVDTAPAHVAGALGVPCWVMIPHVETDWRWLTDRTDAPWYPVGMRIFRQPAEGRWDIVVDEIKQVLQERATSHSQNIQQ